MTKEEREAAIAMVIHALDLRGSAEKKEPDAERPTLVFTDARRLLIALDEIRPVPSAPSIGEAARAVLRAASNARARRKALAELDALVNRAAHGRTKRGERANLLAQLVLVCELHEPLGLTADADLRSLRRSMDDLLR